MRRPFLTAEWRYLMMLNYDVPLALLPPALEVDAAGLYGPQFAKVLALPPSSAFIADG